MSEQHNIPVPQLKEWLERLDEYVVPLDGISEGAMSEFKAGLSDAIDPTTQLGSTLKGLYFCLSEYAAKCAERKTSYVQPLWYRMYLGARTPLLVNYNYVLHSNVRFACPSGGKYDAQAFAAAAVGHAAFYIRSLVDTGALWDATKCDKSTAVDPTLSKDQYRRLFRTCRIPHRGVDGLVRSDTTNVLVLRQGRAFVVPWTVRPTPSCEPHLGDMAANVAMLQRIMIHSAACGQGNHLLELSNGSRDRWAAAYATLWSDPRIRGDLKRVSQCAFCICLDDVPSRNPKVELVGSPGTSPRCADMGVSFVVGGGGDVALSMEHSWGDGSTIYGVASAMCDVAEHLAKDGVAANVFSLVKALSQETNGRDGGQCEVFASLPPAHPVLSRIEEAVAEHRQLAERVHLSTVSITDVGSNAMKKLKVSPDSFVHAAMHIAQDRVFGTVRSTYASLMMKCYTQGRTETLRTVYAPTKALVKIVREGSTSRAAMYHISKAHAERIAQCRAGKGVHRCLLVLRELLELLKGLTFEEHAAEELGKRLLRADAVKELGKDYLSTSAIATRGVEYFSFGPVTRNGLGVGYSLYPENLNLAISSFTDSTRGFAKGVDQTKLGDENFAAAMPGALSSLLAGNWKEANL